MVCRANICNFDCSSNELGFTSLGSRWWCKLLFTRLLQAISSWMPPSRWRLLMQSECPSHLHFIRMMVYSFCKFILQKITRGISLRCNNFMFLKVASWGHAKLDNGKLQWKTTILTWITRQWMSMFMSCGYLDRTDDGINLELSHDSIRWWPTEHIINRVYSRYRMCYFRMRAMMSYCFHMTSQWGLSRYYIVGVACKARGIAARFKFEFVVTLCGLWKEYKRK